MALRIPRIDAAGPCEMHTLLAAASPGDVIVTSDGLAGVIVGVQPGKTNFAIGDRVGVVTEGILRDVPVATGTTFAAGARIGWDAVNFLAVATAGTYALGGAMAAKASGPTRCDVRLNRQKIT